MIIKEYCDSLIKIYEETDKEKQDRSLARQLINKMKFTISYEGISNDSLMHILTATKKIASTKMKLSQILEKELLILLSYLPNELWYKDGEEKNQVFQRGVNTKEGQIAESLISFAKEIFEMKTVRDAFAGKRRGYALQILESLAYYFEVPEFMECCSKSIRSKSKNEFLDCVECLQDYCKESGEVPGEEIIKIIDKRIEKTKHRVEATSGLNFKVEIGLIDEFEALSILDNWKDRNIRLDY